MSDRRWWSLPKVFAFSSLWQNSVEKNTTDERPSSATFGERCYASDDEDIEEFLEKQRNVRLDHGETQAELISDEKPPKKFEEERAEDRRFARSLSRRRSTCSSSSKSNASTKNSSFSKCSDLENEVIKDTIYEITGSRSPISFSFLNETQSVIEVSDDPTNPVYDIITTSSNKTVKTEEEIAPNHDFGRDNIIRAVPDEKERHITKLTILLSPIKNADVLETGNRYEVITEETLDNLNRSEATTEDSMGFVDQCEATAKDTLNIVDQSEATIEDGLGQPMKSHDEYNSDDEMPLYAVIGKSSNQKNSSDKEMQDVVDETNYVELNEYRNASNSQSEFSNMEYCQHRARVKTRLRKISLRRKRKTQPSMKTVNAKISNAWMSIRGWWIEEKSRLKHFRARSANAKNRVDSTSTSEKSFYESVKHLNLNEGGKMSSDILVDENGYYSLEIKSETMSRFEKIRRRSCSELNSTLRRRPPFPPPTGSAAANAFRKSRCYIPQGQDGFEELRRYIKQGGDFCKELSVILQERSEAEIQYAKTLSKLSSKLLKSSKDSVGTVGQAWHKAAIELETTSEIHKTFATALCEDVVKPLKQLLESQHRIRKSAENAVDKTGKNLGEWRAAESKSKKQSFVSARENEKLQDVTLDARLFGGLTGTNKITASSLHLHQKQSNDKESSKLETKRKKAEESVKKSDVEYYTFCVRAERARLEWETAVVRGSQCFQALEEERLQQLMNLASIYWQHCKDVGPKLTQSASRLKEPVDNCDVNADIKTVAHTKGIEQPVSEQLLPDFYAEHTALAMNSARRRQALVKVLQLVVQDLERERRGKNGVENLARAFKQGPNFGSDDSQQNVSEKLHHMRFMLTYLEAARYKISCVLAELDGKPKPSHPLASHIHVIRDRQGFQQSILKVPPWVHKETISEPVEHIESPNWTDRGTADGNSVQPDSDFDEFSSQSSSEKDFENNVFAPLPSPAINTPTPSMGGKCRALYHYTANLYDELNLQPGDIINIHDKQPDGWWLGELNGVVGIFPATYVEEIS